MTVSVPPSGCGWPQAGKPGAPRIVISGLALWGAVVTKTKTTGDRPSAR